MKDSEFVAELSKLTDADQLVWHDFTESSYFSIAGDSSLFIGKSDSGNPGRESAILVVWSNNDSPIYWGQGSLIRNRNSSKESCLWRAISEQRKRRRNQGLREESLDAIRFNASLAESKREALLRRFQSRL